MSSQDTSSKLEYFFLLPALRCFARRYALHPEDKVMAKCLQHIVHSMNFVVGPPIKEAYQHTFVTYWKPDTADHPDRFQSWLNRLDDELRKIAVTTPSVYGGTRFITMTSDNLDNNLPVGGGPIGTSDASAKITESVPAATYASTKTTNLKSASNVDTSAKSTHTKPPPAADASAKTTNLKSAPAADATAAALITSSAESAARAAKNIANGNKAASITDPLPTPATLNQRGRRAHPTPGLSAVAVAAVERRHINPRQKAAINRLMMSAHQARFSANRGNV